MTSRLFVLICVGSLFVVGQAVAQDSNVNRLLNLADKAFMSRKYDKAVKYYTQVIALRPKDNFAYWQRGYIYFLIGKNLSAMNDLNRAIQLKPKDPNAYIIRGMVKHTRNDFDGALADYAVANLFAPNHLYIIIYTARAYVRLGRYGMAIKGYDRALARISSLEKGLIKKSYVHKVGKMDKAIILAGRGRAYYFLKQYHKARSDLDMAIKLAPHYPVVYLFRSELFRKLGLNQKADADYAHFKNLLKKRGLTPQNDLPLGMRKTWPLKFSCFHSCLV